jgi:hypothetical protein
MELVRLVINIQKIFIKMIIEIGCKSIFLSKPPSKSILNINKIRTPKSKGSVGRNILKSRPGTNSYNGRESGVNKTIPNKSLSKAKIAIVITTNTSGIKENKYCSFAIKYTLSAINSTETTYTHIILLLLGKAKPFFVYCQ